MSYLSILPLAIFAGIALTVAMISACIAIAERHHERKHVQRRPPIFRPIVIQGGKMDMPQAVPQTSAPASG